MQTEEILELYFENESGDQHHVELIIRPKHFAVRHNNDFIDRDNKIAFLLAEALINEIKSNGTAIPQPAPSESLQ
jgi:hypothetical protein